MAFRESQLVPKNKLEAADPQISESIADEEIKPEVTDHDNVYDLKSRLKITTEEYQKKLKANEDARKNLFMVLGEENVNISEAEAEEEILRKSVEDTRAEISSLEVALDQGGKSSAEQGEISAVEIEAQLKELPKNEQQKIEVGLHNIGFFGQKLKSEIFSGTLDIAAKFVGEERFTGKFIKSLSETYKTDAKLAERNIINSESDEGKKLTKYSNIGKIASGLLKIATWIGRGPAMGVSSVFARGMETAKEMRLGNENVLEKTRIADMEEAYEEAMKIYGDAKESSKGENPSKIDIQRSYEKNIPKDVLERLSKNYEPGAGGEFLSRLMKKPMEFSAKRLDKQIGAVENNHNLSDAERDAKKNRLLDSYSKRLTDLDRIVSQTGELDTIAMGLKYAEVAGKAVMAGLMVKTAYEMMKKIWNSMPEILDTLGPESASAAEFHGEHSIPKGSAKAAFGELERSVNEFNKSSQPKGGLKPGEFIGDDGVKYYRPGGAAPYRAEDLLNQVEEGKKPKVPDAFLHNQEGPLGTTKVPDAFRYKQEDLLKWTEEMEKSKGTIPKGKSEAVFDQLNERAGGKKIFNGIEMDGVKIDYSDPQAPDKLGDVFINRGYPKELLEKMTSATGVDGKPGPGGRILEFVDNNGKKWNTTINPMYRRGAIKALEKLGKHP